MISSWASHKLVLSKNYIIKNYLIFMLGDNVVLGHGDLELGLPQVGVIHKLGLGGPRAVLPVR